MRHSIDRGHMLLNFRIHRTAYFYNGAFNIEGYTAFKIHVLSLPVFT